MVNYPDLSSLNGTTGISGFMSLPNDSYPFFWAWILAGIFLIITTSSYFTEKSRKGYANILSSMAVSSFAILILATIGSIVGFISLEIMTYIFVLSMLIIGIWYFSVKN